MPLAIWDMDDLIHNIEKMYADLDDEIMKDIARRINKMGYVTSSVELQAQLAVNSGMIYDDILAKVSAMTGLTRARLDKAFQDAGVKAIKYDDAIYKAAGLDPIALNLSRDMQQTLIAGLKKTGGVMENLAMSMPNAGQKAYLDTVDRMYMKISSGAFSYTEALRSGLKEMASKGITVVKYTGKTDKIDVAMRRALLTGISQTANQVQIDHAVEMGADLMEVSAHIGARPTHAVWQGQVYSLTGKHPYKNFYTETGYGTGDGLGGWNCRHSFYPFFEGLSDKNYTLKELNDYDRMRVKYNGEDMSFYEGTQKQRAIEREIRRWKREAETLGAGGVDNQFELRKAREWQAVMRDFVKQTGLVRQPTREGLRVLRVVKPGFVPPHWVPGMGKIKPLPPPPWKKPTPPPAPKKKLVIKPKAPVAPAPGPIPPKNIMDLVKAKDQLYQQLSALPNPKMNERFVRDALKANLSDPMNYRAIIKFDAAGKIEAILTYTETVDELIIYSFGELNQGMGQDIECLRDLMGKALTDNKGIRMVLGTPGNINAEYLVLKQFFEQHGFDVINMQVAVPKAEIAAQWVLTFGQNDLAKFLVANPLPVPGVVPVPVPQPPAAPPVPPPQKNMLIYNTAEELEVQKAKDDYYKYLDDLKIQNQLNDPTEKEMHRILGLEKAGVGKSIVLLDSQNQISAIVHYTEETGYFTLYTSVSDSMIFKRDVLQPLWREALLEGKGINGQALNSEVKNFIKGLGIKIDVNGGWSIPANQLKDSYIQIWGDISWQGFLNKFPTFTPLPPPQQAAVQAGNFAPFPNKLGNLKNGERYVSQDGQTVIVGTNKNIWRGAYAKGVVDIEGNGRALIKLNYEAQSHLGWGDTNYKFTEGFAYRENGAFEVDEILHLGVTPKTQMFFSEDGRTYVLINFVNGEAWGDVKNLTFQDFLKVGNAREEQAKLGLLNLVTGQRDRNNGNWMVDVATGKTWAIDNGLSFTGQISAQETWNQDRWAQYRGWVVDSTDRLPLDEKYRDYLREAIDNGSLEQAFEKAITSDMKTMDIKILDAAMKRAKEIVADWFKYFYTP